VNTFLAAAALMLVGALALVLVPLLRRPNPSEARAATSAVLVLFALPLLAGWLYTRWSNWPWKGVPQAAQQVPAEVAAMVEGLASRLASKGGTLEEWQMLGRSRVQLGQYDAAAEAYRQAYRLSGGSDLATLTSYAETLVLADPESLRADAGDLFERAIALAPQDPKALWYGGLTAFSREQYALARDRWQALLDHDPPPPDDVRKIIAERVAIAESALNGSGPATVAAPAEAAPQPEAGGSAARSIVVEITIAPALASKVNPDAPLFVLARAPGGGGPPLAVERHHARELPLSVELSDDDAMVPGRTLSSAEEVEIVARVALGGQPIATTGDLYGSVDVAAGGTTQARIEIDQIQP
jgi:cytochrome c-type biogenesis protein CcmH